VGSPDHHELACNSVIGDVSGFGGTRGLIARLVAQR
jgi:hypothetical protein